MPAASLKGLRLWAALPRVAGTLALGAAGGAGFWALNLPLPWMLGALFVVMAAALAQAPLASPEPVRPYVVAILGVLLGSTFTADLASQAGAWALSLLALAVYLAIAAALVVPFFIRIGRMEPVTAFFAAMPGGLAEMMLIGKEMGGDDRQIVLAHAARIAVTIAVIAFWFRVVLGFEVTGVSGLSGTADLGWWDAVLLLACAVVGAFLGRRLRLPAATLLGPLVLSALVHIAGLTHAAPPAWLVVVAQVLLGVIMGCRFLGVAPRSLVRTLLLALGATLGTLAVALAFAVLLHEVFGQSVEQVLLAYAPGGLTEMGLVALSMGEEVAYITIHHVARITLLLALAPTVLRWLARWIRPGEEG